MLLNIQLTYVRSFVWVWILWMTGDGTDRLRIPFPDEDHSRNDPELVPGFLHLCSEMFPEWFQSESVCLVSKENSRLDRALKIRNSVFLKAWNSFWMILPSISSITCVIHSSLILGTDGFSERPSLGSSSFVFFLGCCQIWFASQFCLLLKEKRSRVLKIELLLYF